MIKQKRKKVRELMDIGAGVGGGGGEEVEGRGREVQERIEGINGDGKEIK